MPSSRRQPYVVDALVKSLDVLGLVVAKGYSVSLAELVHEACLPKSTVFRYLRSLTSAGFVTHDASTDRYCAGPKFVLLARRAEFFDRLRGAARPEMDRLFARFGQTTNLGVLENGRILYLDIVERRRSSDMKARIGSRDSLHSTALGKAILSHLPRGEQSALLGSPLTEFTFRTITSRSKLASDLALAAERGYALDEEENEDGTMCIGVPILCGPKYPVAAISLSAIVRPRARLPLQQAIPQLVRSAAVISVAFDRVQWAEPDGADERVIRPPVHLSQLFVR
jgi:IclR family acetate operon transcriptional repressor